MTRSLLQTIVIIGCMAAGWVSLSTKLDTNSAASGEVASKLKDQVDAYSNEAKSVSSLAEQNLKLSGSIDDLAKQVLALTQQNTDMGKQNTALLAQIKTVNDAQTEILKAHTQTLKEAKQAAKRSSDAAETAQANTRKALKAITKPTPKPWWHR